jgi:hypothetical protein
MPAAATVPDMLRPCFSWKSATRPMTGLTLFDKCAAPSPEFAFAISNDGGLLAGQRWSRSQPAVREVTVLVK